MVAGKHKTAVVEAWQEGGVAGGAWWRRNQGNPAAGMPPSGAASSGARAPLNRLGHLALTRPASTGRWRVATALPCSTSAGCGREKGGGTDWVGDAAGRTLPAELFDVFPSFLCFFYFSMFIFLPNFLFVYYCFNLIHFQPSCYICYVLFFLFIVMHVLAKTCMSNI